MLNHVAILDDSGEFQQLVQVMLHYMGVPTITHWTNSREALADLFELQPDVLVLDVMMGGIDGLEVWDRLRANPATAQLPIVICTAAVNRILDEEVRLSRDAHTLLLPKPFTLDELQRTLQRLVPQTE